MAGGERRCTQWWGPELKSSRTMALVGISPPWLTRLIPLHPGPSYAAAPCSSSLGHRQPTPPRGWVLGQGPTSFTGPLSSLSFVFGEFNPSSPTSLRVLMTSHCCCDHLFSLTFSSIPQCWCQLVTYTVCLSYKWCLKKYQFLLTVK